MASGATTNIKTFPRDAFKQWLRLQNNAVKLHGAGKKYYAYLLGTPIVVISVMISTTRVVNGPVATKNISGYVRPK